MNRLSTAFFERSRAMMTCIAVALTCWLCALAASPQKPLPDNEIQELVYARLLGRRERVMLLAVAMTIVAFASIVATLPQRAGAETGRLTRSSTSCIQLLDETDPCITVQPGTRAVRERDDEGRAVIVSTYVPSSSKAP
jgi:hypothetical protein